jgi:hypothetical protein
VRTADFGIPLLVAGQAQSDVTHNEAVRALQMLHAPVIEHTNDPPGSASNGDAYLAGDTPTGAWSEWANKKVHYYAGTWYALPDVDSDGVDIPMGARHFGWRVFNQYTGGWLLWDGSAWVAD